MQKLFVKFQVLWKDSKRFRYGLIAALIVLLLIVSTIFASAAYSVDGFEYTVQAQTIYEGTLYPTLASNGFKGSTGSFYSFSNVSIDGVSAQPFFTFVFDFSSLNLSYDYDIYIYSRVSSSLSFDGFLTTSHTFSSSDSSVHLSRSIYRNVVFSSSSVSWSEVSSGFTDLCIYNTSLNSLVSDNTLTLSLRSDYPDYIFFGFIIEFSGSDFQDILYRTGNISSHSDYQTIIGDISDSAASGGISLDEASILVDIASAQDQEVGYNYVVALKAQADSLYSAYQVALAGCTTEAQAQAVAQQYQEDLADAYNDAVPSLSSSDDITAVYTIYKLTSDLAEEDYLQFALDLFNTRNTDLNNQHAGVTDIQQEFLDEIDLVSFDSLVDFDGWMSEISTESRVNFVNLANQFFLSSWKWFFIVPMILNIIALLLGTAAMKFGRSSE